MPSSQRARRTRSRTLPAQRSRSASRAAARTRTSRGCGDAAGVGIAQRVLSAIAASDHREPDGWPYRERFFKRDVGPSRWLMVVVNYEKEPARVVTALGYRRGTGWRFVEPWLASKPIVTKGRTWVPERSRIVILEGPGPDIHPAIMGPRLDEGNRVERERDRPVLASTADPGREGTLGRAYDDKARERHSRQARPKPILLGHRRRSRLAATTSG